MTDSPGAHGREFRAEHRRSLHGLLQEPGERSSAGSAEHVASSSLRPSAKLALLADLKRRDAPAEVLQPLAASLVRADLAPSDRQAVAERLVDYVETDGSDPLRRRRLEPPPPETSHGQVYAALIGSLDPEIGRHALSVQPECQAGRRVVDGQPALSVTTELWADDPIEDFASVVDPMKWPTCEVMSHFFTSMVKDQSSEKKLNPPDDGWNAVVTETVDFGPDLGLPFTPTGVKVTDLDMTFCTTTLDGGVSAISATYSLVPGGSENDEILYDSGYLIAQRRSVGESTRTWFRTKKAVWFADDNTPADLVCPVWSTAFALMASHCLQPSGGSP